MQRIRNLMPAVLPLLILFATGSPAAGAKLFAPGDLLVTNNSTLYEYTPAGKLVQSVAIPFPGGELAGYRLLAGVAADSHGNAYISNYDYDPSGDSYLSTYNSSTGIWSQFNLGTGQAPGNGADGDVSIYGNYLYFGADRFDLTSQTLSAIPTSAWPQQPPTLSAVSIGENGVMYALNGGDPRWQLRESDPTTYAYVGDLNLRDGQNNRLDAEGLGVDQNGNLYAVGMNGWIYEFSPAGVLLNQLNTGAQYATTLELGPNGQIVTGNRFGEVYVTNTALSGSTSFTLSNNETYVAFVPLPEPSTFVLALFGAAGLFLIGRRHKAWLCRRS